MKNPKFVIKTDARGEFRFNLHAKNGEGILRSEGYSSKQSCKNGIESVQKNSVEDGQFDRLEAKNGQFYFNLKAKNNEIIGTSEMYTTKAARDNGIESVKTNASISGTEDTTTATA